MTEATRVRRRPQKLGRLPDNPFGAQQQTPPELCSGTLRGTMGNILKANTPAPERTYLKQSATSKTPGKINLKAVADVLSEHGLDPTEEIVKIVRSGKLEPDVQARILTTLMEYVHSKKKSVEVTGADGGPIQLENVSDTLLLKIAMQAVPPEEAEVIDV